MGGSKERDGKTGEKKGEWRGNKEGGGREGEDREGEKKGVVSGKQEGGRQCERRREKGRGLGGELERREGSGRERLGW